MSACGGRLASSKVLTPLHRLAIRKLLAPFWTGPAKGCQKTIFGGKRKSPSPGHQIALTAILRA